jgi:hypothetical protein
MSFTSIRFGCAAALCLGITLGMATESAEKRSLVAQYKKTEKQIEYKKKEEEKKTSSGSGSKAAGSSQSPPKCPSSRPSCTTSAQLCYLPAVRYGLGQSPKAAPCPAGYAPAGFCTVTFYPDGGASAAGICKK